MFSGLPAILALLPAMFFGLLAILVLLPAMFTVLPAIPPLHPATQLFPEIKKQPLQIRCRDCLTDDYFFVQPSPIEPSPKCVPMTGPK